MISPSLALIEQQMAEGLYHGASLALYKNGGWTEHYLGTIDGLSPVNEGLIYDLHLFLR